MLTIIPTLPQIQQNYWLQPSTDNILIDDDYALMSQDDYDMLGVYNLSYPSGVYPGKMWVRMAGKAPYLLWYSAPDTQGNVTVRHRKLLIVKPDTVTVELDSLSELVNK